MPTLLPYLQNSVVILAVLAMGLQGDAAERSPTLTFFY